MWQPARKFDMRFILWALIVTTIVEGLNIPNREAMEQTARVMKNLAPETLLIRYHDPEDGKEVEVILKKVLNTIPSTFLPIFEMKEIEEDSDDDSSEHSAHGDDLIEARLNNFLAVSYHGVNSYSAITYFPHKQTLHGVIDHRYYIEDLPRMFADVPHAVETFMHPMEGNDRFPDVAPELNRRRRGINDVLNYDRINCSLYRKYTEPLYVEVLLFIDSFDRADHENRAAPHEKTLMYALSYWNAVDMLFSHLKRTQIRINIAGIAVGWTSKVVQLMENGVLYASPANIAMFDINALDHLGSYVYDYGIDAQRSSYDYLIWMTQLELVGPDGPITGGPRLAMSSPPTGCGGRFDEEEEDEMIKNRAVIMHDAKYSNYHTAARALATMMFVSVDKNHRVSHALQKSTGIMDPLNLRIEGCLRWSFQSEMDFLNYARSKYSCCLRNYPYRTMEMPSPPPRKLTLDEQCHCYDKTSSATENHHENICTEPLTCETENHLFTKQASAPLDGTKCETINGLGMCRGGVCI